MIHVLAQIHLRPGTRESFLEEFHKIVPLVLKEEGCLEYGPAVDVSTPIDAQELDYDRVVVVEKWESVEHLEAHLNAEHMRDYRPKVRDFVHKTQLQILKPV
jgi:quinol monooxygenase YgiN